MKFAAGFVAGVVAACIGVYMGIVWVALKVVGGEV
jgi:hypothetical protein